MRVSKQEMGRSHERILEGAARLMRERGIEGTSVGDVMMEAGLTQGGFYRHFANKEALLAEALRSAFDRIGRVFAARVAGSGDGRAQVYRNFYLSNGHVRHPGHGCPIAALAGDVARGPESLKAVFSEGVNSAVGLLETALPGTPEERRTQAIRELAMLAGAVMLARACDEPTAEAVLHACRSTVETAAA